MADPHVYKHGYALLFSDPVYVRELLESFVDKDFADSLDFADFAVDHEKHYLTKDMRDYAEDLVIKVKYQGQEAYIYLLIEFQSQVDKFMALRLLNYVTLFYLDHLKSKREKNEPLNLLPPVFPLVLYNGNKPWTAAMNMRDLIEPHDFLGKFYPDFHYRLVAEVDYSEAQLMDIKNIVSALFLLENAQKDRYSHLMTKLESLVDHEDAHTIALFAMYIKHLANNLKITPEIYSQIKNISNRKEAKSMLVTTLGAIRAEGREEGIEKGKIEMVLAMDKNQIPLATIARCAGLTEAAVLEIIAKGQKK